jgi:hypothetical protein
MIAPSSSSRCSLKRDPRRTFQAQAALDGLAKSELNERLTLSTIWKRAIITVVSAYEESARSMSAGVHVRPFTKFRVVMIDSTSWPVVSAKKATENKFCSLNENVCNPAEF